MKKISINKNTIEYLKDLDVHDSELKEIYCNYDKHIVVIPITLQNPNEKGVPLKLEFINVKKIDVSIYEPWGEGIYINELTVQLAKDYLSFEVLMNSGDKINIIASEMIYQCQDTV